jgi:hypothetical protein
VGRLILFAGVTVVTVAAWVAGSNLWGQSDQLAAFAFIAVALVGAVGLAYLGITAPKGTQ